MSPPVRIVCVLVAFVTLAALVALFAARGGPTTEPETPPERASPRGADPASATAQREPRRRHRGDPEPDAAVSKGLEYEFGPGSAALVVTLRRLGVLEGTLRDEGRLAPGVQIVAACGEGDDEESSTLTTGSSGEFLFVVAPGRWRITVARAMGEPVTYHADIRDDATTTLELNR